MRSGVLGCVRFGLCAFWAVRSRHAGTMPRRGGGKGGGGTPHGTVNHAGN